jgi:uncharacterized protein (DUF885 family)
MFKSLTFILVLSALAYAQSVAGQTEDIDKLKQEYMDYRVKFYPVWATGIGIHDYDSLYTDYSAEAIFRYRNNLAIMRQQLGDMDPSNLSADEYIDYKLLMSDIEKDEFFLNKFPLFARSAALYVEEISDGLYYLLNDNSRTMKEKAPFVLARMRQIGDFIDQRWAYQFQFAPIFYESAMDMIDGTVDLVAEAGNILLEVMPDSSRQIARYMQNGMRDLKSYKIYCHI